MANAEVVLPPLPVASMSGASHAFVSASLLLDDSPADGSNGFDGDDDQDNPLSSLDALSSPASPPLDPIVGAGRSSSSGELSPARASYLQTLLKRFPCPTRANVSELQSLVLESAAHHSSQSIVNAVLLPSSPWLPSLYSLCALLECESDVLGLQGLFALLVGLVNLHDIQLLSLLFDSQHALHSLTVLEYDPAIVSYLSQAAQLKLPLRRHWNAMRDSHCLNLHFSSQHSQSQPQPQQQHSATSHGSGIGNHGSGANSEWEDGGSSSESVSQCLHLLHRLHYAKDVVLMSHLDDPTAATLSQLCSQQRVHVIHQLQRDTTVHQLCRAIHVAADAIHNAEVLHTVYSTREAPVADDGSGERHRSGVGQSNTVR